MSKKTQFNRAMDDLSSKVRSALGVMIGTNTMMYVTPADVAEHILEPFSGLSQDEHEEVVKRVGALLSTMCRKGNCDIFRTEHKMQPKAVNRKAQFGYRIGPSLTPIRTTDVRRDEKITAEVAATITEDPVQFLHSLLGQLTLLKLNALMVEVCGEIQNRVMQQQIAMVNLDKQIKSLSNDFKSLSGSNASDGDAEEEEWPDMEQPVAAKTRMKKKAY